MGTNEVVGHSEQRWDAIAKVKGQAQFTGDFPFKNLLYGKILRSTIAHGRVESYDISEAEKVPGVVKILLPEDLPQNKYSTAGHPWTLIPEKQDIRDRTILTRDVRVYGDDIGAVIAKSELAAIKALEKIKVTYKEYPVYITPQQAMADDARRIHEERDNVLASSKVGFGDVDKSMAEADYIIRENLSTSVQQHVHMENQIAVAYQDADQRWTCVSSTQIPHICRRIIAQAVGVSWSKIRVKKPFIGGGFGNKQDAVVEPLVVAMSMACNGQPVQLALTREESIAYTRTRHAIDYNFAIGVKKDGTITAIDCDVISNQGGYASHGHAIGGKGGTFINAIYKMDSLRYTAKTVYTNIATAGAMRAYGMPQVVFALETVMDDAADKIGMDPIDFRMMNRRPDGFYNAMSNVKQINFKVGECLEKGRKEFEWDKKMAASKQYKTGVKRRGLGVAAFSFGTAVYPFGLEVAGARLILMPDGCFKLMLGSTEIGQGADTALSQMAAEAIGVPFKNIIRDSFTDTDIDPYDTGAYASRQSYVTGFAVKEAAEKIKAKILTRAAKMYDVRTEYIDIIDGNIIYMPDGERLATLEDIAMSSYFDMKDGKTITAYSSVNIHQTTYASGCTLAEVEVDMETGRVKLLSIMNVHDSGKIINPLIANGQVEGGMAMSIGYGLSEGIRYSKEGRPLNNNLLDYKLPTTMDLPKLEHAFVETDDPLGPFGNKSLGENPTVSPAPAIRNAVKNAIGIGINTLPLSPENVYEHIQAQQKGDVQNV
ncbi:xanthine dehydrogenase subunit XdhA [Loigolactobacillus jiayinensis]|uniref:Xanthine dehydrogenase subunit XdhA n=1 Tax=Loigolactobacillus jiayinensis TaxID=2486016 RepID=A0ABW1RC19_9LACO|nr:xanthine dehydrogenase subunit XdhA [Loigolactobacillus jiayinensis]